ncbi:MAG: hypothetical protein PVG90_02505 [Bacillota bacterium]|jgi:hypothetical protein
MSQPQLLKYGLQYRYLDFEYLKTWIERLDLEALWERLISEAVIC